jgi:hypothetical protein
MRAFKICMMRLSVLLGDNETTGFYTYDGFCRILIDGMNGERTQSLTVPPQIGTVLIRVIISIIAHVETLERYHHTFLSYFRWSYILMMLDGPNTNSMEEGRIIIIWMRTNFGGGGEQKRWRQLKEARKKEEEATAAAKELAEQQTQDQVKKQELMRQR